MSRKSNETYLTIFLLLIVAALVFILIKFEILPVRFFRTNMIRPGKIYNSGHELVLEETDHFQE